MIDVGEYAGSSVELDPRALTLALGPGMTTEPATIRRLDEIRAFRRDSGALGPRPSPHDPHERAAAVTGEPPG
jgi:hypothetical protein